MSIARNNTYAQSFLHYLYLGPRKKTKKPITTKAYGGKEPFIQRALI